MSRKRAVRQVVQALKIRRKALLGKLKDATSNRSREVLGDAESANRALESKLYLAEAESQELGRIEQALARRQNRSFGVCRTCLKDIPVTRLRAVPHATRCVSCQELVDSGEIEDDEVDDDLACGDFDFSMA